MRTRGRMRTRALTRAPLRAGVRNGLANGGDNLITCQSSILRLPGSCCSTVTRTSLGIRQAQVAKKTVGLVLAVLTIASRPSSDQTSARSFRKAWLNTVRLPTGLPFGLPETPGGHIRPFTDGGAVEPFGRCLVGSRGNSSVSFC